MYDRRYQFQVTLDYLCIHLFETPGTKNSLFCRLTINRKLEIPSQSEHLIESNSQPLPQVCDLKAKLHGIY